MADELTATPEGILGAPSEPVSAESRSIDDVTVEDLMAFPPKPTRPRFMEGPHVPVPPEEFRELKENAEEAQEDEVGAAPAAEDATVADADMADADIEAEEMEVPEDGVVGPEAAAPLLGASFEGIPQTGWKPPDPTIGVGPGHVLVGVNTDLAGYTKGGGLLFRWPNMTTLFSPVLPEGAKIFDPVIFYDHYEDRYVVIIAARRDAPQGSWILVAASQGGNPAGPYWLWSLNASLNGSTPTNNWADYPMVGFDTQGVYISCNMFQFGGSYQYAKLRILYKRELYSGGALRWYDWWGFRNPGDSLAFSIQPADHFIGLGGNPPAYLVNALYPGGDSLTFWTLNQPVAFWRGGSSSWERDKVNCRSYEFPPDGRQPDTSARLDTLDTRLLHAIYQYVGGVKRLWTAHTSKHTWSGESEARSVLQWYEIDVPTKKVVQQNRFGAPGKYYSFPAIQTDINRNAYIVFARSGSNEYGQLRFTGRRESAALGNLEGSRIIKAGESAYTGGRWGDYFGICRDGGDNTTVWMYGQYADRDNSWGTWVASSSY